MQRESAIVVALPAFDRKPVVSPLILPAGVAHVPSPRQNVELVAAVPLFKSETGTYAPVPVKAAVIVAPAIVGFVPNMSAPLPVAPVTAVARFALDGVARNVPTPVPSPLIPASGAAVAVSVPLPDAPSDAPVPTSMAAVVFVPLVSALNAPEPPTAWQPVEFPFARIPVGALPALQGVGSAASAAAVVAAIVPEPDAASDAPVPTTMAAVVFVPEVSALNAVAPLLVNVTVSAGAAVESVDVRLCVAPEIVTVAVKACGPLPKGGATPGVMPTVNFHCVDAGTIEALGGTCMVNVPAPSVCAGMWPEKAWPEHTGLPDVDGTKSAETLAKAYGTPFGSVIVPLTVV